MDDGAYRRNHYDVTNRVHVADPNAVCIEICRLLRQRYPELDLAPIEQAFDTFTRLYTGAIDGYLGCETWYHDAQHSLDCTLVMMRLIDGHERAQPPSGALGQRRAALGVIAALFHDAGYIRHVDDAAAHGAEFTLYHVQRSGDFLARLLPQLGYGDDAPMIQELVHFTGYEVALDRIAVHAPLDRRLGFLLGTADILAQMADRCYLEKCRDCLYLEFELCGLAGVGRPGGSEPMYKSPSDLVHRTPGFMDQVWGERMEAYFEGAYRFIATHFDGDDPYLDAIRGHRVRLENALASGNIWGDLRRRIECINAGPLRVIIGQQPDDDATRAQARPPRPGNLQGALESALDSNAPV